MGQLCPGRHQDQDQLRQHYIRETECIEKYTLSEDSFLARNKEKAEMKNAEEQNFIIVSENPANHGQLHEIFELSKEVTTSNQTEQSENKVEIYFTKENHPHNIQKSYLQKQIDIIEE